jgi:methylase of polypeptide subunit release factors
MTDLLRGTGVRLGLVTNGDRWTMVYAPPGRATTYARWEASLWIEERISLAAFRTLLGARRFFAVAEDDTIEALFEESANAEQEVTDQLGRQVRQAVELLIDAFGRADREHRGELIGHVGEKDFALAGVQNRQQLLYLAAVTVMMRLVFLLCAEERKLFPLDDELYNQSYAASTLHARLREEADRFGEEPLERRSSAWNRLLATFRMIHGGVQHEDLRIPAYGGSLFDPERFPFLEGRSFDEPWHHSSGRPLPVDDRTVLHIVDALQVLRFHGRGAVTEARRLSFRAIDVEQIGHVYEGLLDHAAVSATHPAVGLKGPLEPEVGLEELEKSAKGASSTFLAWLAEMTGRSPKSIEKALASQLPRELWPRLFAACDNDSDLAKRVSPFHALLREDLRGLPQVYIAGSLYVTKAAERRMSGTYYTPRSLAEEMVRFALEPLVYLPGPAEGADPKDWQLKPAAQLLKLKICDMTMGSGAFLVATCRYLADRLVESWKSGGDGPITIEGAPARSDRDLAVPDNPEDQLILALRLIADRCLYGVDKNPMAVEMAKVSIWLVTLAKDRPFSFLDHAFKCGDSLLGVRDTAQVQDLHIDPARGRKLHTTLEQHWRMWETAVKEAIDGRRKLESFTVFTIRDAELKERLFQEAEESLDALKAVGDAIVGAALSTVRQGPDALDSRLLALAPAVAAALDPNRKPPDRRVRLESVRTDATYWLNEGKPSVQPDRHPFHWPLEFPEVFADAGGFDVIVGNPPFQGGQKITGTHGTDYRDYLVQYLAQGKRGSADLVVYFFLRAAQLVREGGMIGLLATNTISQGDTREVGLDQLSAKGWVVPRAWKSRPWPGDASLEIAQLWLHRGQWEGPAVLEGRIVRGIGPTLDPRSRVEGKPHRLAAIGGQSYIGSYVLGMGFALSPQEAEDLIRKDPRNGGVLFPYLNGEDLNTSPTQSPSRWVINFFDWPLKKAEEYEDCIRIVREKVKPEREHLMGRNPSGTQRATNWWQYGRDAKGLYKAIGRLNRVIVFPQTSKYVVPTFVPTGFVYSHALVILAYDDFGHLGVFSSNLHWAWILTYGTTLETRMRYTPTDIFETFPQPELTEEIARVAKVLYEHQRVMMLERNEGITKIYNRVHNSEGPSADVVELRRCHVELDHAVAAAYGWGVLDLDHGFHDTPQGVRFSIGPAARVEILDRLLELNQERYRQEVVAGLHARKGPVRRERGSSPGGLKLEVQP